MGHMVSCSSRRSRTAEGIIVSVAHTALLSIQTASSHCSCVNVCACQPVTIYAAACSEEEHAERRKLVSRLMYRSKQRGFLELDLLVGRHFRDDAVTGGSILAGQGRRGPCHT